MSDNTNPNQNPNPNPPAAPAESPIIQGGPHENQPSQGGDTSQNQEAKTFKFAGGEFKTPEELAEYTKTLETKYSERLAAEQARQDMPSNQPNPTNPNNQTSSWVESVKEKLFINPDAAIEELRQGLKSDIQAENDKVKAEQRFWNEFYEENQDLKNLQTVVQSIVSQKREALAPLKVADAKKFIAGETRKMVNLIREQSGVKREELPEGGAAFVNGGGRAPLPKSTAQPVPNFVDQIRQMQRRG